MLSSTSSAAGDADVDVMWIFHKIAVAVLKFRIEEKIHYFG